MYQRHDKATEEQAFIDATIDTLRANPQKLWLFLTATTHWVNWCGMEPGEVLLIYLGKDTLRIFVTPSNRTVQYFEDLMIVGNELDSPKIDNIDKKILKIAEELTRFLLVNVLNLEIEKRIQELTVIVNSTTAD